jgi:hypothetical protein
MNDEITQAGVELAKLVADQLRWEWIRNEVAHQTGMTIAETTETIDTLIRLEAGQGKIQGVDIASIARQLKRRRIEKARGTSPGPPKP